MEIQKNCALINPFFTPPFFFQVPNLFEAEEYEQLIIGARPHAKEAGIPESARYVPYPFYTLYTFLHFFMVIFFIIILLFLVQHDNR